MVAPFFGAFLYYKTMSYKVVGHGEKEGNNC